MLIEHVIIVPLTEKCDLSGTVIPEGANALVVTRGRTVGDDYVPIDTPRDAGLLNGLDLPEFITQLVVHDFSDNGGVGTPTFTIRGNALKHISLYHVDTCSAIRLCQSSNVLTQLTIGGVPLPTLQWIPHTVQLLEFQSCTIDQWDIPMCELQRFNLENCENPDPPKRLDLMFPMVQSMCFFRICALKLNAVVCPSSMVHLSITSCATLSVHGMDLPPSINILIVSSCSGIKDIGRLKLPRKLEHLDLSGNNIGWLSQIGGPWIPPDTGRVILYGNPNIDMRGMEPYASLTWMNRSRQVAFEVMYNTQDAAVRFLHSDVLPVDLIRYVYGFLV